MIKIILPVVTLVVLMFGVFIYRSYLSDLDNQSATKVGAGKVISQEAGGGTDRISNLEIALAKLIDKVNKLSSESSQSATISSQNDRLDSLERSVNDLKNRVSNLEDNQSSASAH